MQLEIRTLIALSFVNCFFMGLVLLVAGRSKVDHLRGLEQWGLALLTQSTGWLFIALRGQVHDFLSIVLGNLLVVYSVIFLYRAVRRFVHQPEFPLVLHTLAAGQFVLFLIFTFVTPNIVARTLIVSTVGMVLTLMGASALLRRRKERSSPGAWLAGTMFLLLAVITASRMVYLVLVDASMPSVFAQNPMQAAYFSSVPLVLFLGTIGYILMCNERANLELRAALTDVRTLSGLVPICASCKHIRNDQGYWQQIESYLSQHLDTKFSHGLCPDCARRLYPDYVDPVPGDGA